MHVIRFSGNERLSERLSWRLFGRLRRKRIGRLKAVREVREGCFVTSYVRTRFNKETYEASYTVDFSTKKFPGFRTIHAKNPFTTRTHVISNPSLTQGADRSPTVIKEQLCRTGR